MNRRTYLKTSLGIGGSLLVPPGVLALAGCSGTASPPELAGFDGQIMGTGYSVRLGTAQVTEGLAAEIHTVLAGVDAHMSTWRHDSELTRFNDSGNTDWQPVSRGTHEVVALALDTGSASQGAFDPTVGPLVDLWGFGSGADDDALGRKPQRGAIRETLARVGHEFIELDADAGAMRKSLATARLDLSGIAKGHAVDRVAAALDARGIESYLVEVGGELRSRGRKPDDSLWRVAIERPDAGRRDVFRVVELQGQAIATSGDYRNYFADGGQRYSHSIDPRSGQPVRHELASVSVVAETTMQADALSTALMIMGPDDAMDYADRHAVAAHLVVKSADALEERHSRAFEPLLT